MVFGFSYLELLGYSLLLLLIYGLISKVVLVISKGVGRELRDGYNHFWPILIILFTIRYIYEMPSIIINYIAFRIDKYKQKSLENKNRKIVEDRKKLNKD